MKALIANMSVMRKLGAIMGIATIVLIIETTIFLTATQNLGKSFEAFEHNSFDGVKTVLETEKELNYFSRVAREIMLGGNLEENLEKLDKTHEKIEKSFKHLQDTITSSEQEAFYKQAQHDSMIFITSSRDLMHTIQKDTTDLQAVYHQYHKEFTPVAKASRHSMEKLVESKMTEAADMKKAFKADLTYWSIIAAIAGIAGLLTMIVVMFLIVSQIKGSLHSVQNGLNSFFGFLGGESERAESIPDLGKDEFGTMGSMINENIASLEAKIIEQKQAINDFQIVCSDASQGHLHHRITARYHDTNLINLSQTLNALLDEIHNVFSTLTAMQVDFAQGNYANASNRSIATKGSFASLQQTVLTVAQSNSEIFSLIAKFSREFTADASHLNTTGEELSTSANEQASSLEETAAAIEELTSNVASNVAKTEHMAKAALEAKQTAEKGNTVARESLEAMNEIVSATEAIHQAVDIINNIAFQTNILSLNAAVEAATAGEAGKGFAVVAQEVRNLANRSADAAAQIQELAQAAREKSRAGLETSKHMMESFTTIAQKIDQTDEMVRDVANASHEQMSGINQINGAITQLDQMTQQNAKTPITSRSFPMKF
ncbi:MAG: hypothetical protein CJD30_11195 [Sulfuricurvum sp. PD_MW2]|uniref:methyl-accepting chemotaxis protein n=1 Tax=Sulfuricurvum sp. PD_MW2 TaxID=2027917 RepID=UPI000C05EA16|nr:methyl-accepting chemotaxis protein [Sulfuricurvum sp. PD_MW2]PHM16516.1 MAG: hypothetical protein CJD30_11195 [Sulfuricurvum sp. PD_MW2]